MRIINLTEEYFDEFLRFNRQAYPSIKDRS